MRLPISPRIAKPSDETYHTRSNNKSRVNTIRLSYEKNNHQSLSGRRLSGGSGSSGHNKNSIVGGGSGIVGVGSGIVGGGNTNSRRFIPNVNSPTWRSIQGVMKSKVNTISSPRHYASSPRHVAKYKMVRSSPRGRGDGFFVDNNKVSSSTQELSSAMNFGTSTAAVGIGVGGVVDSYSLTAASTNSVDELEMKFSGSISLEDANEKEILLKGRYYCNEVIEDCNIEARDEEVVDHGHKVFGKDDGEMRDVSLVEMRDVSGQSKEEVSLL